MREMHSVGLLLKTVKAFCGWSPTSQLSKHLTNILKLLTDKSRHKLQSTDNFIDTIKTVQIPDDQKLVSLDVKSLFTSIRLQLALDCTRTAINKSHYQPALPTDDLMDLLHLCLTSTSFQYNGKHYKQLHGTAMGPNSLYDTFSRMLRAKTNLKRDQGQFIRLNAPSARPLTSVRPAET